MTVTTMPPPPWHTDESRAGVNNLHALVARLGRSPVSLTKYRLADGLRILADLEAAGVPLAHTAPVTSVARTYDGEWRLQVRCTRCGALHLHSAGIAAVPVFGQRLPPCGGAPYSLRLDC